MKIGAIEYQTDLDESLKEQLALLISTPVGTVVLDRDFGLDLSCLDMPMDTAHTMLAAELADKIETYIPLLRLREIALTGGSMDGVLNLKVVVELEPAGTDTGD